MSQLVTITSANFRSIISQHEIVVVDFWAQWCEPCLAFASVFEQVAERYRAHPALCFGKVNTELETELATEFFVRSIPTVMLFRQEILVFNEAGVLPATALQDLIEQALAIEPTTLAELKVAH